MLFRSFSSHSLITSSFFFSSSSQMAMAVNMALMSLMKVNLALSYHILSLSILSFRIISHPVLSYPIQCCPILSYPILSTIIDKHCNELNRKNRIEKIPLGFHHNHLSTPFPLYSYSYSSSNYLTPSLSFTLHTYISSSSSCHSSCYCHSLCFS